MKNKLSILGLGGFGATQIKKLMHSINSDITQYYFNTPIPKDGTDGDEEENSIVKFPELLEDKLKTIQFYQSSSSQRNTVISPFTHIQNPLEFNESLRNHLDMIIKTSDELLIIIGLGGQVGTYLFEVIIEYLKLTNVKLSVVCTIPFNFEVRRVTKALSLLDSIQKAPFLTMLTIDNRKAFDISKYNMTLADYSDFLDRCIFNLIDYSYRQNIPFNAISTQILKDKLFDFEKDTDKLVMFDMITV